MARAVRPGRILGPVATGCVFCRIAAGEEPASIVYQDEFVVAFMDIQPITLGHVLVVPRRHAPGITDVDAASWTATWAVVALLGGALRRAQRLRCEGVNLFVADGEEAFQDVFHFHVHLIPRYAGDGFSLVFPPDYETMPPRDVLDECAADIRAQLPAGAEGGQRSA